VRRRGIILLLSWALMMKALVIPPCHAINLIPNGEFEEDQDADGIPDHWHPELPAGGRVVLPGREKAGFGQGYSLVLPGRTDLTWSCRIEGIRPHTTYLFSFWIKREGWREDEYPQITLFGETRSLRELFSWGGWVRYSWYLNSSFYDHTILRLSNQGMTHKVWFDSVHLEEFRIHLERPLPGQVIASGPLVFSWWIPPDDHVLDILLELSISEDFSQSQVYRTVSPKGNSLILQSPLTPGQWFWRIKVYKNRQLIGVSKTSSFRFKGLGLGRTAYPDRSVRGETNRVDFFPLGIYGAEIEALSELRAAGFNAVQNYNHDPTFLRRFARAAAKERLRIMVPVPRGMDSPSLFSFLKELSSLANILAWYIADEPEGRGMSPSLLWHWTDYLHRIEPSVPTSLVVLRPWKIWDYAPAADIVMVDPYPVPRVALTWLSSCIEEAKKAVFGEKPIWAVIQAFDWSAFPVAQEDRSWGRLPTYEEERCLTYLALVHGVEGIFYYTFRAKNYYIKDYPRHWQGIKRIVRELNQIYPLLLAPAVFPAQVNGPVHYLLKRVRAKELATAGVEMEPGYYLIAVNVSRQASDVPLVLPLPLGGRAEELFSGESRALKKGVLTPHFGPYGVLVFKILKE